MIVPHCNVPTRVTEIVPDITVPAQHDGVAVPAPGRAGVVVGVVIISRHPHVGAIRERRLRSRDRRVSRAGGKGLGNRYHSVPSRIRE